ncbi:MAG: trimeric autotransporter adhesin [Actinomycetota bacterium]|nr:trimeric autotransporter adhesin [Actinomycetota bacterium]
MPGATDLLSRSTRTVMHLLAMVRRPLVVLALVAASVFVVGSAPTQAYTNFSAPITGGTDFATGFPACGGIGGTGPVGLIQDGTNFFATDICNHSTYKFPATGGPASGAMVVHNSLDLDLAVSHGKYYATTDLPTRGLWTFDPATLALGHLVHAFPQTAYGVIGDPLSNDLYVDTGNGIWRVQDPDTSPVVTQVVSGGTFDGIAISADGQHIWAAIPSRNVVQEFGRPSPINLPMQASVPVSGGPDGIAIAQGTAPGGVANNVFVNDNNGTIVRIDTNNKNAVSVVASGGSRGDFATVGPDGCFYVTQTDRVVKLAPCFFQSPTADLSVAQTAPPGAGILQGITYNFLVSNAGPSAGTAATFTDTLPAGVQFVSASSGQGSCTQSGGVVTCGLGSVPSGSSVTATVAVTGGLLPGTIHNTATVKASEADPNLANNTSTSSTDVGLLPVVAPVTTPTPPPLPTPTPSTSVLGTNISRGPALPVTGVGFPLGLLGLLGVCLIGAGVAVVRKTRGAGSPPRD